MQVTMHGNNRLFIILFTALIIIDQVSKYIIRTRGGFYICNSGIAFGLQTYWILVIFIASILLILLSKYQDARYKNQTNPKLQSLMTKKCFCNLKNWLLNIVCFLFLGDWLLWVGILLVLSGAISNIIDRLHYGCVVDFIDLKIWPVFNLADIYITIGAIILITHNLKRVTHNERR